MYKETKLAKWLRTNPRATSGLCLVFVFLFVCIAIIMSACNVTRTVTTKAEYYQRGDTTVQIVTRTTESYDGSVKPEMLLKK